MEDKPKDRFVELLAGQNRKSFKNAETVVVGAGWPVSGAIDYSMEFARHYSTFRGHLRRMERPGIAVVAINRVKSEVAGIGFAAAQVGCPNTLLIGRHGLSDLPLCDDSSISLRHFAVIIEPITDLRHPGFGVSFSVHDLRSSQGFCTETGKTLAGIRSDGPVFIGSGDYVFLFFVTGDPTNWPESAVEAWSFIPERVYLEEHARLPQKPRQGRERPETSEQGATRITVVRPLRAVALASAGKLLHPGESIVANMTVVGDDAAHEVHIGSQALKDGILLGRSERCDSSSALQQHTLSRVHLLLIEVAGDVYAIDTASTNGCYSSPDEHSEFRIRTVESDDTIYLGGGFATVHWRWAN